jgi:hypothetical protein
VNDRKLDIVHSFKTNLEVVQGDDGLIQVVGRISTPGSNMPVNCGVTRQNAKQGLAVG